jgi:hypothetical protein
MRTAEGDTTPGRWAWACEFSHSCLDRSTAKVDSARKHAFFFAGAGYCKFERSTGKGRLRTKTCFFNYFGGVDGVLQI